MRKSLALFVLVLACAASAFGQAAGLGSISGVVQDATGSAVPSSSVIIANTSKVSAGSSKRTARVCLTLLPWSPPKDTP